jgi:hypothetical protein
LMMVFPFHQSDSSIFSNTLSVHMYGYIPPRYDKPHMLTVRIILCVVPPHM